MQVYVGLENAFVPYNANVYSADSLLFDSNLSIIQFISQNQASPA